MKLEYKGYVMQIGGQFEEDLEKMGYSKEDIENEFYHIVRNELNQNKDE